MKLYTDLTRFEAAHAIADKGRARNVEIPRKMLINLLMDHSMMVGKLKTHGEHVEKGKPDGNDT